MPSFAVRAIPRTPIPKRFRAIAHILIALVVGLIVGYHCAIPDTYSSITVVPLVLLLGAIDSAYIELANPSSRISLAGSYLASVPKMERSNEA